MFSLSFSRAIHIQEFSGSSDQEAEYKHPHDTPVLRGLYVSHRNGL